MPYLYLSLTVLTCASASIFGKMFQSKSGTLRACDTFYNFFLLLAATVFWGVLYLIDFSFNAHVLWYAVLFSLFFVSYTVGLISALRYGSATLTTLLVSLSLLVTTVWGFFFWKAPFTLFVAVGLVFVVLAIVLCLYTKGEKKGQGVSPKWLFFVVLAFLGNAGCAIVQRTQQMHDAGRYGNMLMFFALFFSSLAFLFVYLKSDRTDTKAMCKTSLWMPIGAGLCNVLQNLLVILLASSALSPSLIYPTIGVGSLAVVTLFSLLVFKEKMRPWQWVGIGFGAAATILLSI